MTPQDLTNEQAPKKQHKTGNQSSTAHIDAPLPKVNPMQQCLTTVADCSAGGETTSIPSAASLAPRTNNTRQELFVLLEQSRCL